jgi:hypothetical protein
MGEEEKYFAFIEHYGMIKLVWWTNTERKARAKVKTWKRKADNDPNVHYYVAQLLI